MNDKEKFINLYAKKIFLFSLDENKKISKQNSSIVLKLIKNNPPKYYKLILKKYLKYIEIELSKNIALIEYRTTIEDSNLQLIYTKMNKYYQKELKFIQKFNKDILGGIRIHIMNDIWEISILDRLNLILKSL